MNFGQKLCILMATLAGILGCSGGGSGDELLPGSIFLPFTLDDEVVCRSKVVTPTIDGLIETSEWADAVAYVTDVPWRDFFYALTGPETRMMVLAKNDGDDLYLAFRIDDDDWDVEVDGSGNPTLLDFFTIGFDEDDSGTLDSGEDVNDVLPIWSGGFFDKHNPTDDDDEFNGFGRIRYHSSESRFHAELRIPLNSGDADDIAILPGDEIGLYVRMVDALDAATPANTRGQAFLFDDQSGYVGSLRTVVAVPSLPPSLPSFTGKIVLISRRDFSKGDIYVYDCVLESLTRITNGITTPAHDFYKDCVSLSHDGQWIAFHGAPTETDYGNYEIYKIKTDGTLLTQLTSTAGVLVGHPGWSPSGTEIVYAEFTGGGGASDIKVMNSTTGALVRRLTNNAYEDNDPDFSPDGTKIVFKSKRWTGLEQLATMDADGDSAIWPNGKNVVRLMSNTYSDHDGVYTADGQWILFERYVGPGLWTDSIQLLWEPDDPEWCETNWVNRAVKPDGSGEMLLSDAYPCINSEWLPVGERSTEKGYTFLRVWGMEYSVVQRIPADGGEPVPLVPELTFVTFFDWK